MTPRVFLPVLFFVLLAALEVFSGIERVRAQSAERQREICDSIDSKQEALSQILQGLLGEGSLHAAHLSRTPAVRDLLSSGNRQPLKDLLLPYLASFVEIDRIGLYDPQGRERYRCERMGNGVASIPDGLLDPRPEDAILGLAAAAKPGEVAISRLLHDENRVEVSESDRRIFHYVAKVEDAEGLLGMVAVTVYAAPLLRSLSDFEPLPGVTSCLLDRDGEVFLQAGHEGLPRSGLRVEELLESDAMLREEVLGGRPRATRPEAILVSHPMAGAPASFLVSAIPSRSLSLATGPLGPAALRASLRTVVVLLAIALGSAFLVRANLRASRLRETESYLARIREESEKQRALLEAAADLILILSPADKRLRNSNPRALEVLGAREENTPEAFLRLGQALGPEGQERLERGIELAAERIGSPILVPSLRLRTVSGETMDVDARCIGIAYAGERLVELSLSDRTKEREMERRVIIAERMSALGLLTAGVAHEINNPLEAIGNYLSLLERQGIDDKKRAQYLEKVSMGWKRIRDIVSELLHFARTDNQDGEADLARTVERATSMARWSQNLRDVKIEVQGLEAPILVQGNEGKLEQVLLNLLLNAGRAMEGKGRIQIVAASKDSMWVELSVQDEGHGIDKADLGRIFDPFFTKTGGTGLGLAVSYSIVQAHGGELTAENVPGGGARFRVLLPRRRGSAADRVHGLGNIV